MRVIFNTPAAVLTVMMSTRAVRKLAGPPRIEEHSLSSGPTLATTIALLPVPVTTVVIPPPVAPPATPAASLNSRPDSGIYII
ncbi:hypothetical protein H0H93_007131 [Arthromyces matolae]|nr:hypothetical protein H0H93_007131 [Arthromyces matolae]